MEDSKKFSDWDTLMLEIAMEPIEKVRDYYYGSGKHKSSVNRLTTIIKKLNEVIELSKKGEKK